MSVPSPGEETWSTGEAARFLGFSVKPRTIGRWIESGYLAGVRMPNGHRRALASSVRAIRVKLDQQAADSQQQIRKPRARPIGMAPVKAAQLLKMAPVKVRRLVNNYVSWCEANGYDPASDTAPPVPDDDLYLKGWRIDKDGTQRVELRVDAADVERRVGQPRARVPRQLQRQADTPASQR